MSTEILTLLSSTNTESADSSFTYGTKCKGAGYQKGGDGVHTAVYVFNNFAGTVKIQATLELYPGDTDWFDVTGTEIGGDSTVIAASSQSRTFVGKFVWIRAAYNIQNGTITEIRYNY
jgi:hypothetical protein